MDEKLLNRIISVAYGDASFLEKIKIYSLASKNDEVKRVLNNYKQTAGSVNNISIEKCPESVLKDVKDQTTLNQNKENSLLFDLYSLLFGRPKYSAAVLSVVVVALISSLFINRPEIHQQYSKQEVELADQQVKQSLALIAGVFNKTKSTVTDDVLTDRVSRPIKQSFNMVNEFLIGENNENIN